MEILRESLPVEIFGEAGDAKDGLEVAAQRTWDLAVLDISLPGESGISLLRTLKKRFPRLPSLVFSFYDPLHVAPIALKLGAAGYVSKDASVEDLLTAISTVLDGKKYIGPDVADLLLHLDETGPQLEKLSRREFEIFIQLAAGKGTHEIALELGLSVKTICTYRGRMLAKMRMQTQAELIRYAFSTGLVDIDRHIASSPAEKDPSPKS